MYLIICELPGISEIHCYFAKDGYLTTAPKQHIMQRSVFSTVL